MAKNSCGGTFARKTPSAMTEELVAVLSGKTSFEFKPLFELVHANLRARNSASGGEEMLRLRVYEQLQNFVSQGMVEKKIKKTVKEYRGLASLSSVLIVPAFPPVQ